MRRDARLSVVVMAVAAIGLAGCETLFVKHPTPPPPERAPVLPLPSEPLSQAPRPPPPSPPPPPPVVRSCVPKGLGPAPRYPDSDAALRAAPGAADRYQLMAAGRILREERLEELERAIAGCR